MWRPPHTSTVNRANDLDCKRVMKKLGTPHCSHFSCIVSAGRFSFFFLVLAPIPGDCVYCSFVLLVLMTYLK